MQRNMQVRCCKLLLDAGGRLLAPRVPAAVTATPSVALFSRMQLSSCPYPLSYPSRERTMSSAPPIAKVARSGAEAEEVVVVEEGKLLEEVAKSRVVKSRTPPQVNKEKEQSSVVEEFHVDVQKYPGIIEQRINKSKSVEELLMISTSPSLILKQACLILQRLGQLSSSSKDGSIMFERLMQDERFQRMCTLVQRGNYSHNPPLLFAAVIGLEKIGVDPSSDLYQTLNIELKWGMRRCPIKYLARAIAIFTPKHHQKTLPGGDSMAVSRKTDITELAIQALQRRWVEVASGSDFISVFKVMHLFDEDIKGKLEDRAGELVQSFTPSEMRQIFVSLAAQNRRPTPLLRALSFHFAKSADRFSPKDLIDLTYALNHLTFADPILMEKIVTNLCPEIPSIDNVASISALVISLGQMRYKNNALMQLLEEWITSEKHAAQLRPFDLAIWILTCAVLNHQSDGLKEFCLKNTSRILSSRSSQTPAELISLAHSFLILNVLTDEQLSAVLAPEVIKSIEQMDAAGSKTKIKLLNLNVVAKRRSSQRYKGPTLSHTVESQWTSDDVGAVDQKLSVVMLESLSSFLPPEKYLTLNQKLKCGVFIDAICMLNQNNDPVPIAEAQRMKDGRCKPVAIIVEDYSSMTIGAKEPTGHTLLNRKLVADEGYRIISVPYVELNSSDKLLRRAKYLEQKIKSVDQDQSSRLL